MPRRWVMVTLFLSSYLPLFFLIGIRSISESNLVAAFCGLLVAAGALGTWLFLSTAKRKPQGRYRLLEVEKRDGDVAGYAATYLLPFVTVFGGGWRDLLSLAAFIGFLGVIYVRSRLIYVNPLLAFFGYHLWQVIPVTAGVVVHSEETPWPRYLLARHDRFRKHQTITAFRVVDDLLLYGGGAEDD
jgi:hypothetical protein